MECQVEFCIQYPLAGPPSGYFPLALQPPHAKMHKNCATWMQCRSADLQLENNIILAPMAGITDLPYRLLMKRFGAGLVFTEMVSANGLVRAGRRTRELLRSDPAERPLGIQLFGAEPAVLAEAASWSGGPVTCSTSTSAARSTRWSAPEPAARCFAIPGRSGGSWRRCAGYRPAVDGKNPFRLGCPYPEFSGGRPHRRSRRGRGGHPPPPHPFPGFRRAGRLGADRRSQGGAARPGHRQRRHFHSGGRPGDADGNRLRRCHDRPWRLRQSLADPGHPDPAGWRPTNPADPAERMQVARDHLAALYRDLRGRQGAARNAQTSLLVRPGAERRGGLPQPGQPRPHSWRRWTRLFKNSFRPERIRPRT